MISMIVNIVNDEYAVYNDYDMLVSRDAAIVCWESQWVCWSSGRVLCSGPDCGRSIAHHT